MNGNTIASAKAELGVAEFNRRFRKVFGVGRLDFVDTIVLNLPQPCHANCPYCIDNHIRFVKADVNVFFDSCERTFTEFPAARRISISGGSLDPDNFNLLMDMIRRHFEKVEITFNTNGILPEIRKYDFSLVTFANVHRFSVDDAKNAEGFRSTMKPISLAEAKEVFGPRLSLRTVVDGDFDFDEYANTGVNLYLNRLIGGTAEDEARFWEIEKRLGGSSSAKAEHRRRNGYENFKYNGVNIRLGMGDYNQTHKPGREALWLNVAIVHRSGIVCGSWFEDDKVLFKPQPHA